MSGLSELQNAVAELVAVVKDFATAHRAVAAQLSTASEGNSDSGLKTLAQQISNQARELRQALTDTAPARGGVATPSNATEARVINTESEDSIARGRNSNPNQTQPSTVVGGRGYAPDVGGPVADWRPGETAAERADREAKAKAAADAPNRPSAA